MGNKILVSMVSVRMRCSSIPLLQSFPKRRRIGRWEKSDLSAETSAETQDIEKNS